MDLVSNTKVEEGMEEEGKLRMVEEEGKLKVPEGKPRLTEEEDTQMAEEDRLKLVGILMAVGIVVLVGIEMVQCMVLMSTEMQKEVLMNTEMQKGVLSIEALEAHMELMEQPHNYVSLLLHNAV